MATHFFESLFNAIFIPGVPPVLAYTTNGSFAVLQVLLLSLLYATHSIHYLNMSILCGGLWWAINWFIREMEIARRTDPNTQPTPLAGTSTEKPAPETDEEGDDGTETEAEMEIDDGKARTTRRRKQREEVGGQSSAESSTILEPRATTTSTGIEVEGEGLQRRSLADSSTDSEWDKLEPELGRKDRR